jgi:flagellar FliL protein
MSEAEKTEKPEGDAAAPKKSKKGLLIAVGALVVVLLIGAPTGYFLLKKPAPKVEDVTITLEDEDDGDKKSKIEGGGESIDFEEGEEAIGAIIPFDTFLVNLSGGKYIRLQVQVEFEGLDVPNRFYTRTVPIRDAILSLLSQQTADDLLASKGKDKLRTSIRNAMNDVLRREDVKRVYFTQFVIQ